MKIVVLAGGGGTRLWPLSREEKPKQFSRIIGDKTMFEETIGRFLPKFKPEDIYICLNDKLIAKAVELAPMIPRANYIVEPEKRDTAPAMGFAAAHLSNIIPDEPIAFVPADHYIGDEGKFLSILDAADHIIKREGKMVDIAIKPAFPSTVLGYTKIGGLIQNIGGMEIYEFAGHTEKPKFEVAQAYLEDGSYLWHASYYMWTPRLILEAFKEYSPKHYNELAKIKEALANNDGAEAKKAFNAMEAISFDYAVTEKMDHSRVAIIKGDFGWSDVGAFDVLYEAQKNRVDENGNLCAAEFISEDATNCLVYKTDDKKLIAAIGMNDFVIVDTDDVLLICPKGRAQDVKKIVQKLKEKNKTGYL